MKCAQMAAHTHKAIGISWLLDIAWNSSCEPFGSPRVASDSLPFHLWDAFATVERKKGDRGFRVLQVAITSCVGVARATSFG